MVGAVISDLSKGYGSSRLFDSLDLTVQDGEFVVLVGPSGCGKSTLLRLIAGLEELDGGEITIGDRRVDGLPPGERKVAMVFQSYALYPQMSVEQNIAFPLRMAKRPAPEIDDIVARTCELLGLHDLMKRRPAQLSGGQRQRVAIGRAIVREPDLFLFDEPLSNLDAGMRAQMRQEFAELHKRLGVSTLYVTHDQAEAMALADRIVLMCDGRIEQQGSPENLYHHPETLFAAEFFGHPTINRFAGKVVRADQTMTEIALDGSERIVLGPLAEPPAAETKVTVAIRPEALSLEPGDGRIAFAPRAVSSLEWFGAEKHVAFGEADARLVWQASGSTPVDRAAMARLHVEPRDVRLFGPDGRSLVFSHAIGS